jgi:hypothetical protein
MAANNYTLKAVDAVLCLDQCVSPTIREAVRKILSEDEAVTCLETEAGRMIEISGTTLYNWRNGKWPNAPHDYIFRNYQTAAGETRYFKKELTAYTRLRRVLCTRENPQPMITREMLLREMAIMDNRLPEQ